MTSSSCFLQQRGFEFSQEEIDAAIARRGLLSIEIELSRVCNFRCPYCYAATEAGGEAELSDAEVRDTVRQARDLGARKIVVLGGEPMLHPRLFETLAFIRGLGMAVEMFTNGTGITPARARALFDLKVDVALKMNTFDRKIQDMLTGREGSYDIIQSAFRNLRGAGYPGPGQEPFLAVSTVLCTLNEKEITKLWIWLRDQDVLPYFEMITPQGNAVENDWMVLDPRRVRELFDELARIDRERYGRDWTPQPPLVGNRCQRHKFSCLVTAGGAVHPCVGVPIEVGNVRERRLAEILQDSEVIQDLRDHRRWIKGPCGSCDQAETCYGCRGAAYNMTGDYLASDPRCWKILDRQDEIDRLPADVGRDIPQAPPMRVVDSLLSIGERSAETIVEVRPDSPFVGADGTLDEAMYVEMVAQSMAAFNGFKNRGRGSPPRGYLLGAGDFRVHGAAAVGDVLSVAVHKTARFGEFGIIHGTVRRGETVLAEGDLKIWHAAETEEAGA